jgi:hypothetical protein
VGNSKGIQCVKDLPGNRPAYCLCLSHHSSLYSRSKPMETFSLNIFPWFHWLFYILNPVLLDPPQAFTLKFQTFPAWSKTLNPKTPSPWSTVKLYLNLYSLSTFKLACLFFTWTPLLVYLKCHHCCLAKQTLVCIPKFSASDHWSLDAAASLHQEK